MFHLNVAHQTERRPGLLCSSQGVTSNRFSCFVLVSRFSTCVWSGGPVKAGVTVQWSPLSPELAPYLPTQDDPRKRCHGPRDGAVGVAGDRTAIHGRSARGKTCIPPAAPPPLPERKEFCFWDQRPALPRRAGVAGLMGALSAVLCERESSLCPCPS